MREDKESSLVLCPKCWTREACDDGKCPHLEPHEERMDCDSKCEGERTVCIPVLPKGNPQQIALYAGIIIGLMEKEGIPFMQMPSVCRVAEAYLKENGYG